MVRNEIIDAVNQPVKGQREEKSHFWRNLIIITIILTIIGGIFYIWVEAKHSEWIDKENVNQTQETTPISQNTDGNTQNSTKIILFIIGGGLIIVAGYLIYVGLSGKRPSTIEPTKIPVLPSRAIELFKEYFAVETKIQCYFNKEKKLYQPANETAITINDRIPFYHTPTGDGFLLLEIEVREGLQQGLHTVIIPIDKGEKIIKGGYYRMDTHTPKFQFQLQRINFPMSSMADKQDRLRMAMLDRMESENINPSSVKELIGQQQPQQPPINPPVISTPMDNFEGGTPNYLPPTTTRRRSYRRSPTRRRYY